MSPGCTETDAIFPPIFAIFSPGCTLQNQVPYFPQYLPYFSPLWTCDGWWLRSSGRRLMGLDSGGTLDYCSHWLHHVASKISIIAGHCQPGMLCYCLCHRLWKSASAATRWRFYQRQIRCRWMVDALVDVTGSHGRHDCIKKFEIILNVNINQCRYLLWEIQSFITVGLCLITT